MQLGSSHYHPHATNILIARPGMPTTLRLQRSHERFTILHGAETAALAPARMATSRDNAVNTGAKHHGQR